MPGCTDLERAELEDRVTSVGADRCPKSAYTTCVARASHTCLPSRYVPGLQCTIHRSGYKPLSIATHSHRQDQPLRWSGSVILRGVQSADKPAARRYQPRPDGAQPGLRCTISN